MLTVNLDHEPIYEALSYEWGPQASGNDYPIVVEGATVYIRENLWKALSVLRVIQPYEEQQPRILWIDYLCINQENTIERNHQVSQMGQIYSQAKKVIAWIGDSDAIPNHPDTCLQNAVSGLSRYNPYCGKRYVRCWKFFKTLCYMTYWTRLWIIQENLLASVLHLHVGRHVIPWYLFQEIFMNLPHIVPDQLGLHNIGTELSDSIPFKLYMLKKSHRCWPMELDTYPWWTPRQKSRKRNDSKGIALVDLMVDFAKSQCCDVRDKMFGIVGFSRQCCKKSLKLDYSMDIIDLCHDILAHHLQSHKNSTEDALKSCKVAWRSLLPLVWDDNEYHRKLDWTLLTKIKHLNWKRCPKDSLHGYRRGVITWIGTPKNITCLGTEGSLPLTNDSRVNLLDDGLPDMDSRFCNPHEVTGQQLIRLWSLLQPVPTSEAPDIKGEMTERKPQLEYATWEAWIKDFSPLLPENMTFFITSTNMIGCAKGTYIIGDEVISMDDTGGVSIFSVEESARRRGRGYIIRCGNKGEPFKSVQMDIFTIMYWLLPD